MNRKRPEPDDESSSSEEDEDEEGEEEEDDESGDESSSEEDDFNSEDDRVNIIPGQDTGVIASEAPMASAEEESSSESEEEEDDTMKVDTEKPADASHSPMQQNIQTFNSDVESEYETESSSGSEGLTQEPAKDVVEGTPTKAMEAPPLSQKKLQETAGLVESKPEEGVQKGKSKAAKQQEKDPPPSRPARGEILKNVQEESQSARKVTKDIVSDDSVRHDKMSGTSLKKRKNEPSQQDVESDSADSEPILKKRKDADMAHDGKKSASKDKVSQIPSDFRTGDLPSSKKGVDRDDPLHTLGDAANEIAKKTLYGNNALGDAAKEIAKKTLYGNNTSVSANGLQGVDSKKSPAGNESKQEKKANSRRSSSSKQKKLPHVWSVEEEIIMASEILNRVKMGLEVPSRRADDFWFTLSEVLQKLGLEFSREQLSEKARRMKQKYQGTVQKIEESQGSKKPFKHKNNGEQQLFNIMSQIWGRAEVTSLEDRQQGVENRANKSIQSPGREVKGMHVSAPKARPSAKPNADKIEAAKTDKIEAAAMTGNDVDVKADAVAVTSTKLHHEEVVKEDQARIILPPPADISASPIDKLLKHRLDATLLELQEWSKRNLEEWMSKAYALVKDSTKRLEDQMGRRTSWMGMAGGGSLLPMRFSTGMDAPLAEGDKGYQQQLHDLQLQELNVHAQRLVLMQKECELKKEQIKAQLHQVQKQK